MMLKRINDALTNPKIFNVDKQRVSRTAFMLMYYRFYTIKKTLAAIEKKVNFSFQTHCEEYLGGLNEELEGAYFKPFDVKSLLDVTLFLSSFIYINSNI